MRAERPPTLYLIAGPNGAGKSSLAGSLLPPMIPAERFVNPDVIAASLNPAAPDRALSEAGRRGLERVSEFEGARRSFALETTLSGRWTTRLVRRSSPLAGKSNSPSSGSRAMPRPSRGSNLECSGRVDTEYRQKTSGADSTAAFPISSASAAWSRGGE